MITLILLMLCALFVYYYKVKYFNYWKVRGVKHNEPIFLFGNNLKNILLQSSRVDLLVDIYWRYPDEKVVGFYRSSTPELIIRDPQIIKKVLITDFMYFYARGFHPDKNNIEPLFRNLFVVEGDIWKSLRTRMTPAFTSGKLKCMFPLIIEKTKKLQQTTLAKAKGNHPLDARDLMARYTTDFIGSCGFGLDAEALDNEKSKNDFVDQLLEYKQKGPTVIESMENVNADGKPNNFVFEFDNDLFVAQVLVFIAAGFETSSSATSYTLHELAFNPDIQRKVQENIDDVLEKHNNRLSYEAVKEMTYLDWAFKEGLRKFPSLGYLIRKCTKQYNFEDLGFTIDEGVSIMIPVQALQMDPKYWRNPEEFRPERFSPEEFTNLQKDVFLAFGAGPRNCIGGRLGLMQSLAGLAAILSKFDVEPAPQSVRHPKVVPTSDIVQSIKGGIPLVFRERT
ncbi:hypothetical protein ACJJTC_007311 [Scirpophaga incertulas]